MTISVTNLGTVGGTSPNPEVLTLANSVGAGALIVVLINEASTTGATGTVTDTAGNTYTKAATKTNNNAAANGCGSIFYAWNVTALNVGNTITYTRNTAGKAVAMAALAAGGIQSSSNPLDLNTTPTFGSSTGGTGISSGTPAVAGELFVGGITLNPNASGDTFTQDTNHAWAVPFAVLKGVGGGTNGLAGGSFVNPLNTGLTYAPTHTSRTWAAFLLSFKPAPSGTAYTLVADGASFGITGIVQPVNAQRVVAVTTGTYILTGVAATLAKTRLLVAEAGAYAISGVDQMLVSARSFAAAAGAYTLSGKAAVLLKTRLLPSNTGSYSISGHQAALVWKPKFTRPPAVLNMIRSVAPILDLDRVATSVLNKQRTDQPILDK